MSDLVAKLRQRIVTTGSWTKREPDGSITGAMMEGPDDLCQMAADHIEGCVCAGNWRAIVKDSAPLLGRHFLDHYGEEWVFFGIVHGDDDYYYGMWREGKMQLLSCVGSLEAHEFTETGQGRSFYEA